MRESPRGGAPRRHSAGDERSHGEPGAHDVAVAREHRAPAPEALAQGLTLEQDETANLIVTADALEGIAAFVEKRAPRFPSREAIRPVAEP